jgi:rfaE bifunctional protein nucleotidyltransferase chain/domain
MNSCGVLTIDEVCDMAESARRDGKVVVLTNGCFDILHIGHVNYLRAARQLGDLLIVGVNSDRSARELKGVGRPYNTDMDRAGVLAALASVSAVTIFDTPTAVELVEAVHPDVYVKGGDYPDDPSAERFPPEGRTVLAYGGVVRIIPFSDGYSTSGLIERIRSSS